MTTTCWRTVHWGGPLNGDADSLLKFSSIWLRWSDTISYISKVSDHLQWKTLQHPHLMVLPSEWSFIKWSASSIELKYKLYEIECANLHRPLAEHGKYFLLLCSY